MQVFEQRGFEEEEKMIKGMEIAGSKRKKGVLMAANTKHRNEEKPQVAELKNDFQIFQRKRNFECSRQRGKWQLNETLNIFQETFD